MSHESTRLKNLSCVWFISGNALIYSILVKMRFSCFPVLPSSAEAQVIWGGRVKRVLIAYLSGNISAKKISTCVHVCQSHSKPKVGRFWTQCISLLRTFSSAISGTFVVERDDNMTDYRCQHNMAGANLTRTSINMELLQGSRTTVTITSHYITLHYIKNYLKWPK